METTFKGMFLSTYLFVMTNMFADVGPIVIQTPWIFFWSALFFMIGGTLNEHKKATERGSMSFHSLINTLLSCGIFGACGSMITVYFVEPTGMTVYLIMGGFGIGGLILGTSIFRRLESYANQYMDQKSSQIIGNTEDE